VLGFRGVGKSSITIQFVENTWVETYYPTIENTFEKNMNFRGEPIALQILDTTGQDELTIFSPRHMVGIHGYLLVYDVTSRQSFRVVQHIYDKICNAFLGDTTHRYIPIVLVGNKCDLDHDRAVTCEEGRQLAQEWQCAFIEVSAKHDENIKAAFHQLLQQVQENEGTPDVDASSSCCCLTLCSLLCCCDDSHHPLNDDIVQDQNGSLMGSPVSGRGRFRHKPTNRKRSRASSAASDYFLSYDGQRNVETSACCATHSDPGCCGDDQIGCCMQCCTLTTKAQRSLYYFVGIFSLLLLLVGIGSMFTGFQIAIQANNVPSIPVNPHNASHHNHTNHTAIDMDTSVVLLNDTAAQAAQDNPVPWKPVNPSNLHGAWFAYGAIGLGLYTVVISLAGVRGVQRLNKDMIRLFSCSALLDLIVHLGTFIIFILYPNFRPSAVSWSSNSKLMNIILPLVFIIELLSAVSSFVLQFNLIGTEDESHENQDADHPYLISSFDGGVGRGGVNQSSTYLADDEMGARSVGRNGGRIRRNEYATYGNSNGEYF
jgi:small GTP-binding protein